MLRTAEWMRMTLSTFALALVPLGPTQAADPPLPPGNDPGGTAIALISTGVDYTDPQIAQRLARDGEGQLIGWDFVDNDITPYSKDPDATALAKLLLDTYSASRLVVVRIDPENAVHLARAAAFTARTPARIAALPHAGKSQQTWEPFLQVTQQSANTLFVISADEDSSSVSAGVSSWSINMKNANILIAAPLPDINDLVANIKNTPVDTWVVLSGATKSQLAHLSGPPTTSAQAAVMIAALAGCAVHGKKINAMKPDAAQDIRAALMKQQKLLQQGRNIKVHDPLCWHDR